MQDLLSHDASVLAEKACAIRYSSIGSGRISLVFRKLVSTPVSDTEYEIFRKNNTQKADALLEFWRKTLTHWKNLSGFSAILTANHIYSSRRELYRACKKIGVPVFVLHKEAILTPKQCATLFSPGRAYAEAEFLPSNLLAFNRAFADAVVRTGRVARDAIFITGMPRMDYALESIPPIGENIVFFYSDLMDKAVLLENTETLEIDAKKLDQFVLEYVRCARRFPRLTFYLKIKNKEAHREKLAAIFKDLEELPENLSVVQTGNSLDLVKDCWIVFALCSTTLVEAAAQGRVVVEPDVVSPKLAEDLLYFEHLTGNALKARNSEDIEKILREPRNSSCNEAFRCDVLEYYNGYADGSATSRVENAILSVVPQ